MLSAPTTQPRFPKKGIPALQAASVTAGQRSALTGQFLTSFLTPSREPVATQLIISNRSVRRLETPVTPSLSTNVPVLIDTNSDTKFRPAPPPAPQKPAGKTARRADHSTPDRNSFTEDFASVRRPLRPWEKCQSFDTQRRAGTTQPSAPARSTRPWRA
jgi:hypothetical protein